MPDYLAQKESWGGAFVHLDVLLLGTLDAVVFAEHLCSQIKVKEYEDVHPCEVPFRRISEVHDRVCCVCGTVREHLANQVAASCV